MRYAFLLMILYRVARHEIVFRLQEDNLRSMLPSIIELYTNVNKLWKDNDIKHRMEWSHAIVTTFLPGSIWKCTQEVMLLFKQLENTLLIFWRNALIHDNIVHPNGRSENNSAECRNPQTLAKYNAGLVAGLVALVSVHGSRATSCHPFRDRHHLSRITHPDHCVIKICWRQIETSQSFHPQFQSE